MEFVTVAKDFIERQPEERALKSSINNSTDSGKNNLNSMNNTVSENSIHNKKDTANFISNSSNSDDKKHGGSLQISAPEFTKGGALTGGRSRASIMRVVMQNLAALRYAYNQRLREKPGLKGKITVKFAIDEFGKIIFCQVVSSTMDDPSLEETVTAKIKRWVFEKIDKPGDVTEVVYPFVFCP
jgi:TonB family protein